jgi:hypothetical protein
VGDVYGPQAQAPFTPPMPPPVPPFDPAAGMGYGWPTPDPAPAAKKRRRRWPWIVGGTVALFAIIGSCSGNHAPAAAPAPAPPAVAPAPAPVAPAPAPVAPAPAPAPAKVAVPNLVGENAAIAEDKLKDLGFTDIDFASVDKKDTVVVLPEN